MLHVKISFSLLFLILSLIVGNRSIDIGDTSRYLNIFNNVFVQDLRVSEPLFIYLVAFIERMTGSFITFLVVVSFVSMVFLYAFFSKIASLNWEEGGNKYWVYIFMVLILSFISPFFWSAQLNVIRSGIAIPLLLLSLFYLFLRCYLLYFVFALSSVLFHYSSIIFVLSSCAFVIFSKKSLIRLFIVLAVLYAIGFWESFVTTLILALNLDFLKDYMNYISRKGDYESGVRLDFLFFTTFFAALIYYIDYGRKSTVLSVFLLKAYLVLTYPFLLIGFISYSDRLLLPVWFLIPTVVALFLVTHLKSNYLFILFPVAVFALLLMLFERGLIIEF